MSDTNDAAKSRPIPTLTPEQSERFWARVDVPYQPSCCWEWTGCVKSNGYGDCTFGAKSFMPHRVAYTLLVGPIPNGLQIDHLCRNRKWVNPDHLEPVTNKENARRGISPIATKMRRNHCHRGHEYTPENTKLDHKGSRVCQACRRIYTSQRTASLREQRIAAREGINVQSR